jgi:hypothetical protein
MSGSFRRFLFSATGGNDEGCGDYCCQAFCGHDATSDAFSRLIVEIITYIGTVSVFINGKNI